VNDEADLVELCAMVLEDQGYETVLATDGPLALELARKYQPDLILLDWVIPRMAGDEVFRVLRADPKTRHIPVMMMSASHKARDAAEALGVDNFLPKPFEAEDLVYAVQETLQRLVGAKESSETRHR
jgi:CheY-like chemotaxis protein